MHTCWHLAFQAELMAANVGDSGFLLIRKHRAVNHSLSQRMGTLDAYPSDAERAGRFHVAFRSPQQLRGFNAPFQARFTINAPHTHIRSFQYARPPTSPPRPLGPRPLRVAPCTVPPPLTSRFSPLASHPLPVNVRPVQLGRAPDSPEVGPDDRFETPQVSRLPSHATLLRRTTSHLHVQPQCVLASVRAATAVDLPHRAPHAPCYPGRMHLSLEYQLGLATSWCSRPMVSSIT